MGAVKEPRCQCGEPVKLFPRGGEQRCLICVYSRADHKARAYCAICKSRVFGGAGGLHQLCRVTAFQRHSNYMVMMRRTMGGIADAMRYDAEETEQAILNKYRLTTEAALSHWATDLVRFREGGWGSKAEIAFLFQQLKNAREEKGE